MKRTPLLIRIGASLSALVAWTYSAIAVGLLILAPNDYSTMQESSRDSYLSVIVGVAAALSLMGLPILMPIILGGGLHRNRWRRRVEIVLGFGFSFVNVPLWLISIGHAYEFRPVLWLISIPMLTVGIVVSSRYTRGENWLQSEGRKASVDAHGA